MVNTRNQRLFYTIGRCLTCLAILALILAGGNYSHAQGQSADHDANHVHAALIADDVPSGDESDGQLPHGEVHCGAQILALYADTPELVFNLKPPAAIAIRLRIVPAEFNLEPPPPKTC